jgi:chromosome partitioning protein
VRGHRQNSAGSTPPPRIGLKSGRYQQHSRPELPKAVPPVIVTVAAWKGGVGKTELAKELAWLLQAVLINFDWDHGNATRAWDYRREARQNAPLIDAILSCRTPRPLHGGAARADLVPCHPDWVHNQPASDVIGGQIERWSAEWQRPIVLDTHPGGEEAAYAAIGVAHVILVPVLLENRPLEALEGTVEELRGYPIMVVPSMISAARANMVKWLTRISETYQVPVTSPISFYRWLGQRQLRMAVSARTPISARSRPCSCAGRTGLWSRRRCARPSKAATDQAKRSTSRPPASTSPSPTQPSTPSPTRNREAHPAQHAHHANPSNSPSSSSTQPERGVSSLRLGCPPRPSPGCRDSQRLEMLST